MKGKWNLETLKTDGGTVYRVVRPKDEAAAAGPEPVTEDNLEVAFTTPYFNVAADALYEANRKEHIFLWVANYLVRKEEEGTVSATGYVTALFAKDIFEAGAAAIAAAEERHGVKKEEIFIADIGEGTESNMPLLGVSGEDSLADDYWPL